MNNLLSFEKSFRSLGTDVYLKIVFKKSRDERKVYQALNEAEKKYEDYEERLSRFNEQSEISLLNKKIGLWQEGSSDVLHLAKMSLWYNKKTKGIFDPRIASQLEAKGYDRDFSLIKEIIFQDKKITTLTSHGLEKDLLVRGQRIMIKRKMDFTGLAKGYITDQIADFFRKEGFMNFLVDSGGDMFASGRNKRKDRWIISLEGYPEDQFRLEVSNKAIATSGITRKRWTWDKKEVHHLVDPRDPEKFDFNLRSVTVIDKTVEFADVWAKTLFILGKKKGFDFARRKKIKAIFLDTRGDVLVSDSIKNYKYKCK